MKKTHYNFISFFLFLFTISISIANVKAQNKTFGYVNIGGGGYVCSVIESIAENLNGGNTYYAKTDVGGISRWNEITKDWTPLFGWCAPSQTSYLGTEALAIDPNSPNKLYSIGGTSYWNNGISALMRSSDYGDTWETFDVTSQFKANGNGSDRQKGETLAVDPYNGNTLFFGTRYSNGLFKSADAGKTWSKVTTFPDSIGLKSSFAFVAFDYNTKGTIYVGNFKTSNNVFVTKDYGATWKSIGGFPTGKPQRCTLSVNDGILYVTYTAGTGYANGAVKKYNTATEIWNDITPAAGRNYGGISVFQNSPNKLVTTTYNFWSNKQPWGWADAIYYSEDGGTTWKEKASNCTMDTNGIPWMTGHAMHWIGCATMSQNKPGWVFVCSGNGIFATENIAAAIPVWKVVSKGLEETVPVGPGMISIPDGPFISAVGDQGGFVHTDISKAPLASIGQSDWFAFAAIKPTTIVRTMDASVTVSGVARSVSNVYISENNGSTWTMLKAPTDTIANGTTAISADASIILWKGNNTTLGTRCYWTTNKGENWTLSSLGFNATPIGDAVNPLKFYAFNTTNGYMYKSVDGGKTFQTTGLLKTGGSSLVKVALGNAGHIWINNNGTLKYSTDEGTTFTQTTAYACSSFALGKAAPNMNYPTVFIWGRPLSSSPEGLYRSIDKGITWVRANDDAHQWGSLANAGTIEADQNVYGLVYKSTAGMGIPWIGINTTTDVSNVTTDNDIATIYPNPFINNVTLKSRNSILNSIDIYNLQGTLVKKINSTLYNNESLEFGNDLLPSVYMVKVSSNNGFKTYKIVKQ
ncbi:MAG: T9SS type A sorting domain-containing protein [Paludibacter sp.]|nr:T9SS type A sorting domain-containing protein [Paludibacter sp.]